MAYARPTGLGKAPLRVASGESTSCGMWDEPYLETCCRSALHRLALCGELGRPAGLKDGPCLERLASRGLACKDADGRYRLTSVGRERHYEEVLRRPRATKLRRA